MSEDLSREEVHQAVDRLVAKLLEDAGVSAPPVDTVELARTHLKLPPPPSQRGKRRAEPPSTDEGLSSEEQQQWLAAQHIGAHFKPALLRRLGVNAEQSHGLGGVSLANLIATHLLMPIDWFADDARATGHDLLALKQRYSKAGVERLAWRLLDLAEACIITVVDNGHVVRRRSNAWQVRRELCLAERECQHYVHHFSRPRVIQAQGWTVQGWPVHRPDWKREILRSVGEPLREE
jgi:hypothetical protein